MFLELNFGAKATQIVKYSKLKEVGHTQKTSFQHMVQFKQVSLQICIIIMIYNYSINIYQVNTQVGMCVNGGGSCEREYVKGCGEDKKRCAAI